MLKKVTDKHDPEEIITEIKPLNEDKTKWKVVKRKNKKVVYSCNVSLTKPVKLCEFYLEPFFRKEENKDPNAEVVHHEVLPELVAVFSDEPEGAVNRVRPTDLWFGLVDKFEDETTGKVYLFDYMLERFGALTKIKSKENGYTGDEFDFESAQSKKEFIEQIIFTTVQFSKQRVEIGDMLRDYKKQNPKFTYVRIFQPYKRVKLTQPNVIDQSPLKKA